MKKFLLGAAILVGSIGVANATVVSFEPISGLVNTGVDLANKDADTNYTLNGSSNGYAAVGNGGLYIGTYTGSWLADSATSHWLTPSTNRNQSYDPSANGTYTWSLQFDLTGYDASSASFTGRFAADNKAIAKLNGNAIGTSNTFSDWSLFAASSGFVSGVNTLDFVVTNFKQNGGNPTGLRVEFLNSAVQQEFQPGIEEIPAVPEPEEWAMMMLGLPLMGFVSARRRKAA